MVEHRWIERVIADLRRRLHGDPPQPTIDPSYVERLVEFLRIYADRCHHGKEENIFFRALDDKELDLPLRETLQQLTREHEWARATTKRLVEANASAAAGDQGALGDVGRLLGELASFYPEHIQKGDKGFFRPALGYLSRGEQEVMLHAFTSFDASLVHERYRRIAEGLEADARDARRAFVGSAGILSIRQS